MSEQSDGVVKSVSVLEGCFDKPESVRVVEPEALEVVAWPDWEVLLTESLPTLEVLLLRMMETLLAEEFDDLKELDNCALRLTAFNGYNVSTKNFSETTETYVGQVRHGYRSSYVSLPK